MSGDRPDDDTAEQQVLRFDDLLPGGFEPMPTTPPRRRRHVWVFAIVALALVAGGVAGFGLTRQSTAAAKSPASPSLTSDSPTPPTSAPGGSSGTAATLPSGQDTLVLGDSLALIMYPWLADLLPDRYVSYAAQVGSSTGWALARLEQMRQDGERIPKVVLVSAGTNDFYAADFETEVAGVLDLLGPKRCVVWADIARPEIVNGTSVDPASRLNEVLSAAALAHPNLRLLGWDQLTTEHPTWLAGDGVHPIDEGSQARAEQYAAAAAACSPIDPDAPTAAKQVLPTSAFYGGSGSTPGTTGGTSTGGGYTPAPTRSATSTPSPSHSRTARPTKHPRTTPKATPSPDPTTSASPDPTAEPAPTGPAASPPAPKPTTA